MKTAPDDDGDLYSEVCHLHLPIAKGELYCFVFSTSSDSHPPYFSIFPKVKRSAYVIVDLDAITHNLALLRGCCENSHAGDTRQGRLCLFDCT